MKTDILNAEEDLKKNDIKKAAGLISNEVFRKSSD